MQMAIDKSKADLERANTLIEDAPLALAAEPLESELPLKISKALGETIMSLIPLDDRLKTVPGYVEQIKANATSSQDILLEVRAGQRVDKIDAGINAIGVMSSEAVAYGGHTELMRGAIKDAVQHIAKAIKSFSEYEEIWSRASESMTMSGEAAVAAQETIDEVLEIL